ncbi:PorP/SprF family type IX secretion system membrane protein [Robiginitalea sp. IMCC43444]|uniref:PorP/SprF family type IX secretion system membrane protein n=1 Tax=Robiginitalea sp. IMCC43444 TaxID=3459121 RepID=UPI004042299E
MKHRLLFLMVFLLALPLARAQEDNPFIAYDVPAQNLLKFNRFLINPTFSTVREDKSYINLLHRNQAVSFDDNNQTYFLSYSGRIGDRSGLGLSLYTQREGTLSNYGVLANYAYGIKLSDKSNFTFGANLSYYSSGYDESRANPLEVDPFLNGFQDISLLTFQPGFNISFGAIDFGMYAENLIDYNLKTSESITSFADKTFSGHLQYTHQFENGEGVFEGGRLMPLARVRKIGNEELVLGGNLILDLPKIGWLQGGYDSFYGASAGIGFNLNQRLSIGYTMEKGLTNNFDNFGLTHEISFAYSFTPNLTEDRVMLEDDYEESLVSNEEEPEPIGDLTEKDQEIMELKSKLAENDAILAELMFRQDSIEKNRQRNLEKRFEMVMRMVRQETGGKRPDLEDKAKTMYFINNDSSALAQRNKQNKTPGIKKEVGREDRTPEPTERLAQTDVVKTVGQERQPVVQNEDRVAETTPVKEKDALSTAVKPQKDAIARVEKPSEVPTPPVKIQKYEPRKATAVADNTREVKMRRFKDLQDVTDGYYLVANVYKGTHYMDKFIDQLKGEGLDASYIDNPNNGLKYVYINRFDSWEEAAQAARSGLGGAYDGQLWVMNVDNRYSNEAYAANSEKIKDKTAQYETDVLRKNVVVQDKVAAQGFDQRGDIFEGAGSAYYIIVNVFANPRNANRFVKLLNSQGLSASYFINPENNYRYVYLKRHSTWNSALISYYSKINDTYDEKMWIMRVTPNLIA